MGLEIAAASAGKAIAAGILVWWHAKRGGSLPRWLQPVAILVGLVVIYLGYASLAPAWPFV
jgi:hypothetical protein